MRGYNDSIAAVVAGADIDIDIFRIEMQGGFSQGIGTGATGILHQFQRGDATLFHSKALTLTDLRNSKKSIVAHRFCLKI